LDEKLRALVAPLLPDGEEVEAAVSGTYATLSGGTPGYGARGAWRGFALRPVVVVLTNRRLVAVRAGARRLPVVTLEADRSASQAVVKWRVSVLVGSWTTFVFHDRQLKLLVDRRSRDDLEHITGILREDD
jgi:hypothetical protein